MNGPLHSYFSTFVTISIQRISSVTVIFANMLFLKYVTKAKTQCLLLTITIMRNEVTYTYTDS